MIITRNPVQSVLLAISLVFTFAIVHAQPASAFSPDRPATTATTQLTTAATKPSKPNLVVVPGAGQFQSKWSKVPGASKYVLEYATNSGLKNAKRISLTGRLKTVKKLPSGKYWVRVTAVVGKQKLKSKVVPTQPTTAPVGRFPITVSPAGENKVKITWKRVPRATKLVLIASYDNKALPSKTTRFSVKGIKPTQASKVVTIPKAYRKYIGTGSGNPAYFQIWAYNGARKSTSPIAYGLPSAPKVAGTTKDKVSFAAYNVGSIVSTKDLPRYSWAARRQPVARALTRNQPDVIAVQEATTAKHSNGNRHYEDLGALLAPDYKLAYSGSAVGTAGGGSQTKGDHIFYRPSKLKVLSSGLVSPRAITPSSVKIAKDRVFAWARMENRATGARFYVVSIHLQTGATPEMQRLRLAVIKAINEFIAKKPGAATEPIVMLGDYNSDVARYPNGAPTYLRTQGFVDAAATDVRIGLPYATTNNQTSAVDGGYPAKPFKYAYSATRIDYILVKNGNGSFKYENQVVLKNGKFDEKFRGSDHNLQYAELAIKN